MNDITLVSAFFPINREEWTTSTRTDEKYFEYFKFWARIKNKLVVYTIPNYVEIIKNIRRDFGLPEDKTEVIGIPNVFEIDPELYNSIKSAASCEYNRLFRLRPLSPEVWNAEYDYLMALKTWFVYDAVNRKLCSEQVAWMDFGYNHGGEYYSNSSEFDRYWNFDTRDKITIFLLHTIENNISIVETIRRMDTYIMGSPFILPSKKTEWFWLECKNNMLILNRMGIVDDDQTLMLMSYLENKNEFNAIKSTWNNTLKTNGMPQLTVNENFGKSTIKQSVLAELHRIARVTKYQILWTKELLKYKEKL